MPHNISLHRVLAASPEKVYRAFVEPDALAKWIPPNGFTCTVHHQELVVGGTFRSSFRNFTTGASTSFGGRYLELLPGERLRSLSPGHSLRRGRSRPRHAHTLMTGECSRQASEGLTSPM